MTTVASMWQNCLVLPYMATTEPKAEQFADAIEALFDSGVKTEVFEDGGKWGVAVVEGMNEIDDPVEDPRISSAVILLSSYNLTDGTGGIDCIEQMVSAIPESHRRLTRRARRSFRMEAKLDAILAALSKAEMSNAEGGAC